MRARPRVNSGRSPVSPTAASHFWSPAPTRFPLTLSLGVQRHPGPRPALPEVPHAVPVEGLAVQRGRTGRWATNRLCMRTGTNAAHGLWRSSERRRGAGMTSSNGSRQSGLASEAAGSQCAASASRRTGPAAQHGLPAAPHCTDGRSSSVTSTSSQSGSARLPLYWPGSSRAPAAEVSQRWCQGLENKSARQTRQDKTEGNIQSVPFSRALLNAE